MKTLKSGVVCAVVMLVVTVVSFAHPPSAVNVKYDAATARLSVEAVHGVKNENSHFIDNIKISLNNKELVNQNFIKQLDKQNQPAEFIIPGVKPGDQISVSAKCNMYGSKSASIKVK